MLRENRISVELEAGTADFFELVRGTQVEVIRLPDIVHDDTLMTLQFHFGIAAGNFFPKK